MKAHWYLKIYHDGNTYYNKDDWRCSNCDTFAMRDRFPNMEQYCHCCGAHMVETPKIVIENTIKNIEGAF